MRRRRAEPLRRPSFIAWEPPHYGIRSPALLPRFGIRLRCVAPVSGAAAPPLSPASVPRNEVGGQQECLQLAAVPQALGDTADMEVPSLSGMVPPRRVLVGDGRRCSIWPVEDVAGAGMTAQRSIWWPAAAFGALVAAVDLSLRRLSITSSGDRGRRATRGGEE
jgi:hypothetical protein